MNLWKLISVCLLCLFPAACSSVTTKVGRTDSSVADSLAGVWVGKTEFADWVIERNSDGTFREHRNQKISLSKPSARIESVGQWKISGRDYVLIYEESDNPAWKAPPSWRISAKILSVTPMQFEYLHREGLKITEARTAKAFSEFTKLLPVSTP